MNWITINPGTATKLERAFKNRQIDFTTPGFCDHPNFLAAEQANPRILEAYAQYVEARPYSPEYLAEARIKIEAAASALHAAVAQDGRMGSCVDTSGILGRMLDKLGVWNYVAKSCLTIRFPAAAELPDTYFYGVDYGEMAAPHAIVVAPPFYVVDLTAKYQAYEANHADFIPGMILAEQFVPYRWTLPEIVAPEVAMVANHQGVSVQTFVMQRQKGVFEVPNLLPARQIPPSTPDDASLGYTIIAVAGSIEPLEGITNYKPCGRTGLEIFQADVLPRLG